MHRLSADVCRSLLSFLSFDKFSQFCPPRARTVFSWGWRPGGVGVGGGGWVGLGGWGGGLGAWGGGSGAGGVGGWGLGGWAGGWVGLGWLGVVVWAFGVISCWRGGGSAP